jgi:hypothetical protein
LTYFQQKLLFQRMNNPNIQQVQQQHIQPMSPHTPQPQQQQQTQNPQMLIRPQQQQQQQITKDNIHEFIKTFEQKLAVKLLLSIYKILLKLFYLIFI